MNGPSMSVSTGQPVAKPRLRGVSHLYAFFVSIVAAVALVATAPSGTATIGATIYGITLVGMPRRPMLFNFEQTNIAIGRDAGRTLTSTQ